MPVCQKCQNNFPTRLFINGKERNLQRRKFCLECSPFGSRNTKSDLDYKSNRKNKHKFICKTCGKEKYQKGTNLSCNTCRTNARRKDKRNQCIKYAGGKCKNCGYNACLDALDFHHIDPLEKSFELSSHWNKKFATLKVEIDKCLLLCSNCHREVHAGFLDISHLTDRKS